MQPVGQRPLTSDNLYRAVAENFPRGALFVFDREYRYLLADGQGLADAGLRREDLIGRCVSDVFPPDLSDIVVAHCRDVFRGQSSRYEVTYQGRVYDNHAVPIYDDAGAVHCGVVITQEITERQEAESALRASEARIRLVFDALPVLIGYVNTEERYEYVNRGFQRWFGDAPQQMVGRTVREVLGDEHYAKIRRHVQQALSGIPVSYERRQQLADGSLGWAHATYIPNRDSTGQVVGFFALIEDITERKTIEEAVRTSERRLKLALEAVSDAVWEWDIPTDVFRRGRQWYQLTGFSASELEQWEQAHGSIIHPDDEPVLHAALARHLAGESPGYRAEFRIRHRSGAWRWILGRGRIVQRDADGRPVRMIGADTDVTGRKEVEEALRKSEEQLARAQAMTHLGSWSYDFDADVETWSDENYRIFGYPPQRDTPALAAWLGRVHVDDVPRVSEAYKRTIDADVPYDLEYRIVWPNGQVRHVHARGEISRHPDGRPARFFGTTLDITTRVQLEEQLRQSQKMEAVGQLAGGVAHDFNNILTAILGNVELLRLNADGESQQPADLLAGLEQIERAAQRAATLTRQLLAFSRRQIAQPTILSVNQVLADMDSMLRRLIPENVELRVIYADNPWRIHMDASQLEQIVMNLVVNARDAMPTGGAITLRTANVTIDADYTRALMEVRPGKYVALVVQDTGSGIDPRVQPRIFEPFFTTKSVGQGTGLGLATVHGIVRQVGGHVAVNSAPGQGATFCIYLPAQFMPPTDEGTVAPAALEGTAGNETVLVCEDDDVVRTLTCRTLRRHGYVVLEAANARHALEIADDHQGELDLLLTDVIMPGLDGRELASKLRAARPDISVLFVSGYPADVLGTADFRQPGAKLLGKPFTSAQLLEHVRRLLNTQV